LLTLAASSCSVGISRCSGDLVLDRARPARKDSAPCSCAPTSGSRMARSIATGALSKLSGADDASCSVRCCIWRDQRLAARAWCRAIDVLDEGRARSSPWLVPMTAGAGAAVCDGADPAVGTHAASAAPVGRVLAGAAALGAARPRCVLGATAAALAQGHALLNVLKTWSAIA